MDVQILFDKINVSDETGDAFSVVVSLDDDVFHAHIVNVVPPDDLMNSKADAIENSASGSVASFPDGANGVPMKSLIANISPIQDLHGYDHPWAPGAGKNLCPNKIYKENSYRMQLGISSMDESLHLPAGTYRISVGYQEGITGAAVFWMPENGSAHGEPVIELSEESDLRVWIFYDGLQTSDVLWWQIEAGSTATSYTPYSNECPITGRTGLEVYVSPTQDEDDGTTHAVDWTATAGTVYGGSVDVVSGPLSSTMDEIESYNGETIGEPWISSLDDYAQGATPTMGAQVVYTTATPRTYQLTPQEVKTLLGQNYIWSDSGDVSVDYIADTKKYIDNKILQAIAAALNS